MGARLYNPAVGRFESVDPVYGGNADTYNYPDDPIDGSDPTGLVDPMDGGSVGVIPEGVGGEDPGDNGGGVGGRASVEMGKSAERAVERKYRIGPKARIRINGRYRILDGLTRTRLSEVKNVAYQTLTRQIMDELDWAYDNGRRFDLYVRRSTKLSKPLQRLIDDGFIKRRYIP